MTDPLLDDILAAEEEASGLHDLHDPFLTADQNDSYRRVAALTLNGKLAHLYERVQQADARGDLSEAALELDLLHLKRAIHNVLVIMGLEPVKVRKS